MTGAGRQTIFKRVRSAGGSYTVVNNDIIDDAALQLDELAALVKLLRKPGDWIVYPRQLRGEFGIGRSRFYRIMRALRQRRYLHYAEQHGEDGLFIAGVYSVYDGRCAPVSEIDMRGGNLPEEDEPRADFPHTDDPHADNAATVLRTNLNQPSPPYPPEPVERPPAAGSNGQTMESKADAPSRRADFSYSHGPPFNEFWSRWKATSIESRPAAERAWTRLSEEAKRKACAGIAGYNAACARHGQRRCHAKTYLRDRHFESVAPTETSGIHEIKPNTRSAGLWAQHYAVTGQRWKAEEMGKRHRSGQSYFERSEFPPEDNKGSS